MFPFPRTVCAVHFRCSVLWESQGELCLQAEANLPTAVCSRNETWWNSNESRELSNRRWTKLQQSLEHGKRQRASGEASELWWSMFCSHPPARGACVHPSELLNVGQAYMQSHMKSISAAWSKILVAGQRRSIPDAGDVIHKFSTADSIQWCRTAIPKYNAAEGLWHVWLANVLFNSCTVCSPALVN